MYVLFLLIGYFLAQCFVIPKGAPKTKLEEKVDSVIIMLLMLASYSFPS
jgi:hypothetical protein